MGYWFFVFQGMVIAETKRQMHETLEMKEEEIAQLRSRLQQAIAQKEEVQEQKEKAEKSGTCCPCQVMYRKVQFFLDMFVIFFFPPSNSF